MASGYVMAYEGCDEIPDNLSAGFKAVSRSMPRCLIPGIDGASLSSESKEALWARFSMEAPRRQRRSVERYSIVMSGRRPLIKGLFSAMGWSRVRSCLRPVVAVL